MTSKPDIETETRFELYIQGKITGGQRASFEVRLREDKEFKAMFEAYRLQRNIHYIDSGKGAGELNLTGSSNHSVSMKDIIDDIEKYGPSRAKTTDELEFLRKVKEVSDNYREKRVSRVRIYAAAAVVLLAVLSTVLLFTHRNRSTETLYAANYKVYPYVLQTRGGDGIADPALLQGLSLYAQGEYRQAADILSKTEAIQKGSPLETLYLGICYIETGNLQQALAALSRITSSAPNIATHQANWYLGLLYLKTNDIGKSKYYFNQEAGSNSSYAEKSRLILKKLN